MAICLLCRRPLLGGHSHPRRKVFCSEGCRNASRQISPSEADSIVEQYLQDVTAKTLARMFKRTQKTIYDVLHERGIAGLARVRANHRMLGKGRLSSVEHSSNLQGCPTPTEWAYIAGIFDGEGCLNRSVSGRYRVDIAQNGRTLHEWLLSALKGGGADYRQKCGRYRLTAQKQVFQFLLGVQPYVIVKRSKVESAVDAMCARYSWRQEAAA